MATYRLKRKIFSGNPQDPNSQQQKSGGSGWGTVGKIGAGLAAVGGGLWAGKAGWLGTGIQNKIGRGMMNIGMVKSGANTIGQASLTNMNKALAAKGAKQLEGDAAKKVVDNIANKQIKFHEFKQTEAYAAKAKAGQEAAAARAKAKAEAGNARVQSIYGAAPTASNNATTSTTGNQTLVYS